MEGPSRSRHARCLLRRSQPRTCAEAGAFDKGRTPLLNNLPADRVQVRNPAGQAHPATIDLQTGLENIMSITEKQPDPGAPLPDSEESSGASRESGPAPEQTTSPLSPDTTTAPLIKNN